nr:MAG TPA: hypothetical protein [Caudoviricetes sp.]
MIISRLFKFFLNGLLGFMCAYIEVICQAPFLVLFTLFAYVILWLR